MRPSLLYRWLKIYVRLAFAAYYRRYRVQNVQNVPVTGPVIFAINHQNAFMVTRGGREFGPQSVVYYQGECVFKRNGTLLAWFAADVAHLPFSRRSCQYEKKR